MKENKEFNNTKILMIEQYQKHFMIKQVSKESNKVS